MSWAGLEAETDGLAKAWVNLEGDAAGMAVFTYARMSDYFGPDHPGMCEVLLQRLIGICAGSPSVTLRPLNIAKRVNALADEAESIVNVDGINPDGRED